MRTTEVVIVLGFLVSLLLIGLFVSRKVKDADDWMVAGKSLGVIPLAGTYFATIISSVSVVGYLGYYYGIGWGGWWNWAGTAFTTFLCAVWFARKIRTFGKVTLSDYLEDRFGPTHARLGAVIITIAMIFLVSAQLAGSAAILTSITGWDRALSIIILAFIFMLFTVTGGMNAVAWTDTFSAFLIIIGVFLLLPNVLGKVGGISGLHKTLSVEKPDFLDPFAGGKMPLGLIVSWIATWGIGNFGAPQFITRFNSAKDVKSAEISQGVVGILLLVTYIPIMLIALGGALLFPGIEGADNVAPFMINELLSPVASGVVLAGLLAASISTADSVLLLGATTFVNDLYVKVVNKNASQKQIFNLSRLVTVIIAILAVTITMNSGSTIMWIQANAVGFMGSMLAMVVLIGFAWRRANSQGALAGMVVGLITAIIWYILDKPFGWFPILPSIFTSTLATIVVSLMTPEPPKEIQDKFFGEGFKETT